MSVLKTDGVTCGYGKEAILEEVNLTIHPGEVLALIGPNGSGKTTLIKAMCRIIRPQHGRVLLDGHDIWEMHARRFARSVARVEQTTRLTWPFSVNQIVQMGRFPHRGWISSYTREDHEQVDQAIHATGLWEHRYRNLDTLSGGEFQRAMVARAVAQTPRVLVLDEPVAHLDIKYKIAVLDLVRSLSKQGIAVVVSLHDLNLASLYADKVALLSRSRMCAYGTPMEILTRETLEPVYETAVMIGTHPANHRTMVIPIPSWLKTSV